MLRRVLDSLRFRIAAGYVLLIVAAFAGLGVYVVSRVEHDYRSTIEDDLAAQARMVASALGQLTEAEATPERLEQIAGQLGVAGTRITVIAPDGTVLADSQADPATMENHLTRPEVQEAIAGGQGSASRRSATLNTEFTYLAVRVPENGALTWIVRVARPSEAVDASVAGITRSILIAVAITAGAAALLSLALGTTIMRPLGRLARTARSIAGGNLAARVSPRPSGEIGELADSFNHMAGSLEALIAAASQERNRLVAALNSSVDAVIAADPDGRITFANAAAERLFMRSQEELVGNPFAWVLPNEQVLEALRASREEGLRQTSLIERPSQQHLQVITTPIVGGGEWAALVVFHDLTDVKRTEQMRRDFIGNVSHELRTPLASVKSVLDTLEAGALEDRAAAHTFVAQAHEEVDRLVQLVEELLELSKIESGQYRMAKEPVEMAAVVERAVERLRPQAERQGIRLELDVRPELPPVTGDAERLERAVANLIHNAVKFSHSGGSVQVSAAFEEGAVRVRVCDSGVGIPAEDLPRVFERFYKSDRARHGGGTGLGLAIVKHTVAAHGGTVGVLSEEGQGSTFSISIPAASLPLRA
jgi:two-component system phosphate regulon sensor histidine kinase PhoR